MSEAGLRIRMQFWNWMRPNMLAALDSEPHAVRQFELLSSPAELLFTLFSVLTTSLLNLPVSPRCF